MLVNKICSKCIEFVASITFHATTILQIGKKNKVIKIYFCASGI